MRLICINNIQKKNGVTYGPPDGIEEVPMKTMLEDYEKLNDDEMLKKYGIQLTSQVWKYFWEKEDERKIKSPEYFHD